MPHQGDTWTKKRRRVLFAAEFVSSHQFSVLAKSLYPLVCGLAEGGTPACGEVPGAEDRASALPPLAHQPGHRLQTRAGLLRQARFAADRDDPEFGYRFLVYEAHEPMAERTASPICSQQGWWSTIGKNRGHQDPVERRTRQRRCPGFNRASQQATGEDFEPEE